MAERFKPKTVAPAKPDKSKVYRADNAPLIFIPSGCTLLDQVISGGWVLGRTSNIVGDRSTGKTLLAIEAMTNALRKYPRIKVWYREAEAAFDMAYAQSLGLPIGKIDFGKKGTDTHWTTIEQVFTDLDEQLTLLEKSKSKDGGLYIIDSLDALTSEEALKREPGQASYNTEKPKIMSEEFPKFLSRLKDANVHLMFISQVRDNIGVMFGEKHKRSGGHALDFYCSQVVWLSQVTKLTRTEGGVKRVTGIRVRARCKKNKVGQPFRDCEFVIRFGYGVDDIEASIKWLEEVKRLDALGLTKEKASEFLGEIDGLSDHEYTDQVTRVQKTIAEVWAEVESRFLPKRSKYGVQLD